MRRCAAAFTLAVALLVPAFAHAELKMIWGGNTVRDGRDAYPLYEDLGVDVLQMQLVWSRIAPTPPADPRNPDDPAYHWPASVDLAYQQTQAHHMRLALLARSTPAWANGGRPENWVPLNPRAYADFLVAAAKRYERVKYWMIWGEPNRAAQFEPLPPNSRVGPRAYARLLDRAYGSLKRLRRSNKIIGGMSLHFGDVLPADWVRWMRLPNGKPPRLDMYGHNPFTSRPPALSGTPTLPGQRDMSDVDTLKREVRRHWRPRHRKPKLWLSEFCVASDRANYAFGFHVTRDEQADWLSRAFAIAHRKRYIAAMGWFNFQDEAAADGITCGLLDGLGLPKPAYLAFKLAA